MKSENRPPDKRRIGRSGQTWQVDSGAIRVPRVWREHGVGRRKRGALMRRVSLILTLAVSMCGGTGCAYQRTPQRMIEPSYSHHRADAARVAEPIWPVRDPRSARAAAMPRLPRSAGEESVE